MKRAFALIVPALLLAGCAPAANVSALSFDQISLGPTALDPSSSAATSEPNPVTDQVIDTAAELEIEDQSGDGSAIRISEVRVGRNGTFLVIYDNQGVVLASGLVSPQSQIVNLVLDIPITVSQELQAVFYLDDGDGIFELTEDSPLYEEQGELVHEDFDYVVTGG